MKKFLLITCFTITIAFANASVDTVPIYSAVMHRSIKTVVVKPASYGTERLPVVYLLHGAFGSYSNWITKVPHIQQLADLHKMIIVCPDGGYTSWYFDSPVDTSYQFETFVGVEIPKYIDAHYNTIADRKGRAITGLSMGGHGGIFLAFRHADLYSACGSTSGALNVSVIRNRYDVEKRLGDTLINKKFWTEWSALKAVEQYPKDSLSIIIDCGTDDFVLSMNRAMHAKLLDLKIPHDYTERPGKHDWAYWSSSIDYQLLFFRRHFNKILQQNIL